MYPSTGHNIFTTFILGNIEDPVQYPETHDKDWNP